MVRHTMYADVAEALLACRSTHELTLRDVAEQVGLSVTAVSNIERGVAKPRRSTRARLLEFLRERGYRVQEAA